MTNIVLPDAAADRAGSPPLSTASIAVAANRTKPSGARRSGATAHQAPTSQEAAGPAIIVLGRDDADRPHASWFTAEEAALATKAAGLMAMLTLPVTGEVIAQLAAKLPHGRVFASGKAFVPFVRASTFDALLQHLPAGVDVPTRAVPPRAADAAAETTGATGAGGSAENGFVDTPAAEAPFTLPPDWPRIVAGSLVLASEGGDDGWYESVVLEDRGEHLFVLRWRDWPDLPTFVRRREHLALLHPSFAAE